MRFHLYRAKGLPEATRRDLAHRKTIDDEPFASETSHIIDEDSGRPKDCSHKVGCARDRRPELN